MMRQETQLLRIARNTHEYMTRVLLPDDSLDSAHDISDPDTKIGAVNQKYLVNHLMGPPTIKNTSPAVTALALMFSKQLHT